MDRALREFPVPVPARMRALPVDRRGYPVPASWKSSTPAGFQDRLAEPHGALRRPSAVLDLRRGDGRQDGLRAGSDCCINRISSEPPSHYECAHFAAVACPFLAHPQAKRPIRPAKVKMVKPGGDMSLHNPGVACIWVTKRYAITRVSNGVLFEVGEPERVEFFAHARPARSRRRATFSARLAQQIRVNAIAPGVPATEGLAALGIEGETARNAEATLGMGRLGQPDDIARIALFLASGQHAWLTGERIAASVDSDRQSIIGDVRVPASLQLEHADNPLPSRSVIPGTLRVTYGERPCLN